MKSDESMLRVSDLSVTYPDGHRALESTSLEVARGEFLVLLGASGAGKSTLLRSINGLVLPSSGCIHVDGLPGGVVSPRNLREHRRNCGMVFQQHHLIGRQTVLANVLMGMLANRGSLHSLLPWRKADKLQALAAIDRVGLLEKALARADTLSGGQQQRVGIARALVQSPRLLLADEPVASLDPATAQGVLTLLYDICKKDRLTVIVSLHQVNLARMFADRVIGISSGCVVFEGCANALTPEIESSLYARNPSQGHSNVSKSSDPGGHPSQTKEFQPC